MYIIKVYTGNDILTYTFQEQSSNDTEGIFTFLNAFKKEFKDYPLYTSLSIMKDNGLYYNIDLNEFVAYYQSIALNER